MYEQIKRASQMNNERRIVIDEVDAEQLFVTGRDSFNKTYRLVFDFHSAVVSIPIAGEMWIIDQYNNEWRLSRRADTGQEIITPKQLQPGDRRLEAPNDLHLNGARVLLNGTPFGLSFTLSSLPAANTLPAGTIVFVSDATTGQQFKGTDGSSWKNLG